MIDNILFKLLILDGNETSFIESDEVMEAYKNLIIELTKVKYDIRFCGKDNCPCHPEFIIKNLLKIDGLVSFLKDFCGAEMIDEIGNLIENYEPIVAKGIYD